jgi:hypothetical protein
MLLEAGYQFNSTDSLWINELVDRQLDAGIARGLTVRQLLDWLKAGALGRTK